MTEPEPDDVAVRRLFDELAAGLDGDSADELRRLGRAYVHALGPSEPDGDAAAAGQTSEQS